MATAKKQTTKKTSSTKYVDLIQQTDADRQKENIDILVAQSKLNLKQATNSIEGEKLKAVSAVNDATRALKDAEVAMIDAKRSCPLDVQALIVAEGNRLQATQDLETAEETLKSKDEWLDKIDSWTTELF